MEKFIIAIPSYQRAETQGTLKYLSDMGVEKDRVFIFVQTEQDYEKYQRYVDKCGVIYAKADGIAKARNNILRHFKGVHDIFMLDDDVNYIGQLKGDTIKPISDKETFDRTIGKCFEQARRAAAPLWGVYPVNNAFFMQRSISTKVTVNTAVGFPKGQILTFNETFSAKEDIELCARVLNNGKPILRYNFLSVNAKHRTNAGGCFEEGIDRYFSFPWCGAAGYNTGSNKARALNYDTTMAQFLRDNWNTPSKGTSPAKGYGGILRPIGRDANGDIVYKFALKGEGGNGETK